jgi:hypothetical protein
MKATENKRYLKMALTGLPAVAITLGLTSGSVLAAEVSDEDYKTIQIHKQKEAEKQLSPSKRPAPPSTVNAGLHANLAQAATNPLAPMIQFELQNKFAGDSHNSDGYGNTFVIQPVIPIKLPYKRVPEMITRTTLPYVSTPDLDSPVNRRHGFGDLTLLAVGNIPIAKGQMIGAGGSFVFPTAGDNEFTGSGKYSAGPALAYINTVIPKWQLGLVGWQQWSYASGGSSGESREDVSDISIQPLVIRHFDKGWYAGLPDDPQKYNWKTNGWTWSIGFRVGRVIKLGKLPVNLFVQPVYNPNASGGSADTWAVKANMTMLFPE